MENTLKLKGRRARAAPPRIAPNGARFNHSAHYAKTLATYDHRDCALPSYFAPYSGWQQA